MDLLLYLFTIPCFLLPPPEAKLGCEKKPVACASVPQIYLIETRLLSSKLPHRRHKKMLPQGFPFDPSTLGK